MTPYNIAIILAGGKGERLGFEIPKQFLKFAGKTCLEHSVNVFYEHQDINEIVIVVCAEYVQKAHKIFAAYTQKPITIITGGQTRNQSTFCALQTLSPKVALDTQILIHDSVRPLIDVDIINRCLQTLKQYDAVDTCILAVDTIIQAQQGIICEIPKREYLYYGQTPQGFRFDVLWRAYCQAHSQNPNLDYFSDDCGLLLAHSPTTKIGIVKGEVFNHKLTHVQDIAYIEHLFYLKSSHISNTLDLLKDKVIVVIGGTSGIGQSIVQIAKDYGAKVFALSRRVGVDVCDSHALKNAFKTIYQSQGRIDAVMNLAGVLYRLPLLQTNSEQIQNLVMTNYIGNILVAQESHRYLKQSQGMLIFTSSSSYSRGREGYCIYSSLKASIINLTQALADEWSDDRIAVNCVVPGRTQTPMRIANFGQEESKTLLQAEVVAKKYLETLLQQQTGLIIPINTNYRTLT